MGDRSGEMLAVLIAALPQHVQQQSTPLRRVD
jgi:hypothetical protein